VQPPDDPQTHGRPDDLPARLLALEARAAHLEDLLFELELAQLGPPLD